MPNAKVSGAGEGTNTGHENAEGMACVGVRLTDQLGHDLVPRFFAYSSRSQIHFNAHNNKIMSQFWIQLNRKFTAA
jgi:hypothetical protein